MLWKIGFLGGRDIISSTNLSILSLVSRTIASPPAMRISFIVILCSSLAFSPGALVSTNIAYPFRTTVLSGRPEDPDDSHFSMKPPFSRTLFLKCFSTAPSGLPIIYTSNGNSPVSSENGRLPSPAGGVVSFGGVVPAVLLRQYSLTRP